MSDFEKKKLEIEFKSFILKHFEKPSNCKNLEQVRFYVQELSAHIQEFEQKFSYVPESAYALLSQYNSVHSAAVHKHFVNTYC